MKGYDVEEVRKIVKGSLIQLIESHPIENLIVDSRKVTFTENSIFIALVGERRDGHQFINELYQKGVRNFIVSQKIEPLALPHASIIEVKNTLAALQSLAAYHRSRFQIPVIGITGSNGKTIVKEWLYQMLEPDYRIVRSPKSYNSQTGVPLSVWQIQAEHQLGIFEAGISQPGEMANLEKIIKPLLGIFTNIGEAHNEGFLNIRQKINEKLTLFTYSKLLIYCKDYPELNECILAFHNRIKSRDDNVQGNLKLFNWSKKNEADLKITRIDMGLRETFIQGEYQGNPLDFKIPFTDDGSIENAIHCLCMLLYLEIPKEKIRHRMEQLGNVAMRLELKQGINECSLINDSYNSDLGSLTIALDFLLQQKQYSKRTLILSDILQSGKSEIDLYKKVYELLVQKKVTRLIGIGKNISKEKKVFLENSSLKSRFYKDTTDFILEFNPDDFGRETILLKGARVFEFERIGKLLEQKVHKTVLEINLSAVAHNLKQFRLMLRPGIKIMAMVKAFSYGSGSFEIANLLQFHGIDYLAVAYADEGVELRRAGISLPIMVMNSDPSSFETILNWNLEPEIYTQNLLTQFEEVARSANRKNLPIHIKLDTGMHRLGFEGNDMDALGKRLKRTEWIKVVSIFSHLAASEDPNEDSFTRRQGSLFGQMSQELLTHIPYKVLRHISNSSATHRHPQLQLDMVRLGIGLYGIDPDPTIQGKLRNVSSLKTTVAQVKKLEPGETVGYGRKGMARVPTTIATIGIGYADGYNRVLGNGRGKMMIRNQMAPVIGNICMDMLMLDITQIPEVREGDEVLVFGNDLPLERLAGWAGTIPYEIMTTISQRVKRIYYEE